MTTRAAHILVILLAFATQGTFAQPGQDLKFVSRDEYRSCLEESDKLTPRLAERQAQLGAHNQALKRLQDEMRAHVAVQPVVEIFEQAAVDAFNAKTESLNQQIQTLNDQGEKFNQEQIAYNTQVAAMNKRCAGMAFSFKDRDAVRKERLTQGKK
jgi:uncharacterized protein YhaN